MSARQYLSGDGDTIQTYASTKRVENWDVTHDSSDLGRAR